MLHQQREPLAEFISCPVCCKVFNHSNQRPMSLSCGHTVCKACLHGRLGNERCPFDQEPFPKDAEKLPSNYALMQLVEATNMKEASEDVSQGSESEYDPKCYEVARQCIQEVSVYLKPLAENSSDDEGSPSSSAADKAQTKCFLSRPLQRKVISLIQCQILEEEGRSRAARIARSVGERILSEVLTARQYPHQLSANLWAAVRARGCQFLGPAMQEEVLKLILLTLENGCMLSRKVLVLYVVGKLSATYPHVSKTAIGHVVQLLYRASCFKVAKREEESSLMQLKEEFREYEALRREHDAQIVQIAMEAGLRIPPEQWTSLLYGDMAHKSHMQSIMDKLQNPQSFSQCVLELVQVLQRNGDPGGFLKLRHRFEFLSCIDPNPDGPIPSLQDMKAIMQSLSMVMKAFVAFMAQPSLSRRGGGPAAGPHPDAQGQAVPNAQYKTSMCWDVATKGYCPRGNTCTFAHTQQELERHRQRSRRNAYKLGPKSADGTGGKQDTAAGDMETQLAGLSLSVDGDTNINGGGPSGDGVSVSPPHSGGAGNGYSGPMDYDSSLTGLGPLADPINPPSPNGLANPHIPPPIHSGGNSTLLTYSQPAKEAPGINYLPQSGLQTSFHPHNMRGPPPPIGAHHPPPPPCQSFIPPEGGYPPSSGPQHNSYPLPHPYHQGQQLQNTASSQQQQQPPVQPRPHSSATATTSVMHDHHQHHIRYPTHSNNAGIGDDGAPASSQLSSSSSPQTPITPVVTMSMSINSSGGYKYSSYNENYSHKATVSGSGGDQQLKHHQQQHYHVRNSGDVSSQYDNNGANLILSSSSSKSSKVNDSTTLPPYSTRPPGSECVMAASANPPPPLPPHHQQQPPQLAMRMATHSFGGPDGALQSLTNSHSSVMHHQHHHHHHHHRHPHPTQLLPPPQENTLEDLKMMKQEIIDLLQEEPTFLKSRPQVYCADSLEGGFDGLKTVLGNNQRKKEAMPKLVSDMFVATRSTTSLDMLPYPPECPMPGSEPKQSMLPPFPPSMDYPPKSSHHPAHISDRGCSPSSVSVATSSRAVSAATGNPLYNSLGSSFEIASSLSNMSAKHAYPDTEFSCFPTDDDDEGTLIPFEHTVVSKFGPISRMARAKTNNCAPVQVTADSSKKMTPVLAVNPIERPMPIAMPATCRFGSFAEQMPEPSVKPTPTIAPSVWQESPEPSQVNIAMLRTGAAEAVSNNERLAYELQAVELEISLKTGKSPEPVRKMIHEAVSNPTSTMSIPGGVGSGGFGGGGVGLGGHMGPGAVSSMASSHQMAMMMTSTSTSSTSSSFSSHSSRNNAVNMGHGHVTEFLNSITPGSANHVSSELAAHDILEEYQRSRRGLSKFSY